MKSFFRCTLLCTLCILICFSSAWADLTGYSCDNLTETLTSFAVEISDAEGLMALCENPEGHFVLTADIDMSGVSWTPIPFSGCLDGNGHVIYNLTVRDIGADRANSADGNLINYPQTAAAGFFSVLKNAEVRNLSFIGADIRIETDEHCFAAGIAGIADHALVENCSFEGRVYLYGHNTMEGVGGIAGFGCGDFNDCSFSGELFFANAEADPACEQFMGGVLACGVANIDRCTVNIDGYDSCCGYVHNGALVGMYYFCNQSFSASYVRYCTINGQISFFENNPVRRAYCSDTIGELLNALSLNGYHTISFKANETDDFSQILYPDKCPEPVYSDTTVRTGCSEWSYTLHRCDSCGYEYCDAYTPPSHGEGVWTHICDAGYECDGLDELRCEYCAELLDTRVTPALVRTEKCTLSQSSAFMTVDDCLLLSAEIFPISAADCSVLWSSSDPAVACVDDNGMVYALKPGSASITCSCTDAGAAPAACTVSVQYSTAQWIRHYILFGWLKNS